MEILSRFHPLVREWFHRRFDAPTSVQEKTWAAVADGQRALITAPTGSGKTPAAFLWALNGLITGRLAGGRMRILYLSPLKALNNDIQKNLLKPLSELEALEKNEGRFGAPFLEALAKMKRIKAESAKPRKIRVGGSSPCIAKEIVAGRRFQRFGGPGYNSLIFGAGPAKVR